MKKIKFYKKIYLLCALLMPIFFVILIISLHSNKLFNQTIKIIDICLLVLSYIGFIYFFFRYKLNNKKVVLFKKVPRIIITSLCVIYTVFCFTFAFILYGPNHSFKNWLITTAMKTMNHQYLCKWFYSIEDINKVLNGNYVLESGESTDTSLIKLNEKTKYNNEYDEAVLKKDKNNKDYKIIKFKVNGCNAYLAVIYDPANLHLVVTKNFPASGEYVTKMAEREGALIATNGGGFYDPGNNSAGGTPTGITIKNGEVVTNNQYGYATTGGIIGITNENKLVLLKNKTVEQALDLGVRDAVSWGPFLIVNGKKSFIKGNGGWGYAARTAIGQREDGIILLLVVDSNATRTNGADMVDLTEIMVNYGAINAANLDGGTSSVMVENNLLINDPIDGGLRHKTRPIATAWILKK